MTTFLCSSSSSVVGLLSLFLFSSIWTLSRGDEIWKLQLLDQVKYPHAKCLDGSPAGFWFIPGTGDGISKFAVHHEGGGWCVDDYDCYQRSLSTLGSSLQWEREANCDTGSQEYPCVWDGDEGITGFTKELNPIAWNWNKIYLGYCDGASFSGQVAEPVSVSASGTHVNVYYKGRYILDAVYETLLFDSLNSIGLTTKMSEATEIILSGTSAGGLSIFLHADYLREKIHKAAVGNKLPRIVALPDAGYFMDYPAMDGTYWQTPNYKHIYEMQNVSNSVNADCVAYYRKTTGEADKGGEEWKCFMAPYTLPFIKTEMFISQPLIDSWQGENILGISCNPNTPNDCSTETFDYLNQFRHAMLYDTSLQDFLKKETAGAWLLECWTHPIVNYDYWWETVKIQNYSQGVIFANWYRRVKDTPWIVIDGEWGSNKC